MGNLHISMKLIQELGKAPHSLPLFLLFLITHLLSDRMYVRCRLTLSLFECCNAHLHVLFHSAERAVSILILVHIYATLFNLLKLLIFVLGDLPEAIFK